MERRDEYSEANYILSAQWYSLLRVSGESCSLADAKRTQRLEDDVSGDRLGGAALRLSNKIKGEVDRWCVISRNV